MKTFDIYGFSCGQELDVARRAVEAALGIALELHESSWRCGDYYRFGDAGSEHFILQRNYDEFGGEWTVESLKEYALLLYVNESQRAEALEGLLVPKGFVLVKREKL